MRKGAQIYYTSIVFGWLSLMGASSVKAQEPYPVCISNGGRGYGDVWQSSGKNMAKDSPDYADSSTCEVSGQTPDIRYCVNNGGQGYGDRWQQSTRTMSKDSPDYADSSICVVRSPVTDDTQAMFDKNASFYVDPYSQAANDARSMRGAGDPNAPFVEYIAQQGAAVWLGTWSGNVGDTVRSIADKAEQQNAWPVLVAYMIPYRDCGQHSAGGLDAAKYLPWITEIANAVGSRQAIVILEPDAVPGLIQKKDNGSELCLSSELRTERINLLKSAIKILKSKSRLKVFVDAGHSAWLSVDDAVSLLNQVGIADADGFALNTSNYQSTASNNSYGQAIRSRVGNKSFVIDTSRNGIDPGRSVEWCNPRNRALGVIPSFHTGVDGVAAYIWGKRPGESDGTCNGGPAAGTWWRDIAVELASNADIK